MADVEIELNPVAAISVATSSGDGGDVGAGETVEATPVISPTAATADATGAVHTDEVSVAIEQPVSPGSDGGGANDNGDADGGADDGAAGDEAADGDGGAADTGEHKTTKKKKKKKANRERGRSHSKKNIVVNQGADLVHSFIHEISPYHH